MLKKKKKTDRPLLVTAMIVLVMVVVSACQNEYYTYQKYFKIEKVYMTRISIEDFPIDDAVLYLIEPAFSNCPPETIKYDGTMRGTPSYSGGSIDTITNITFTHDRKIIHPIQLHWNIGERNYISPRDFPVKRTKDGTNNIVSCNNADTLDAIISIEEKGSNVTYDAY